MIDTSGMRSTQDVSNSESSFPRLPEELIKLILEYACRMQRGGGNNAPDAKGIQAAPLDLPTTLCVALVSKGAYNLVNPILYRSVTLSRPSQLIRFADTLLNRPSLGLLTRNLWVGELEIPLHQFLPLIITDAQHAVAAKLHILRWNRANPTAIRDETCNNVVYLESGVEYATAYVPRTRHCLVKSEPSSASVVDKNPSDFDDGHCVVYGCGGGHSGIDSLSLGFNFAGEWIGSDEWMLRCLEVQYAIEFHFEWVNVMEPSEKTNPELKRLDDIARQEDPMDWGDAQNYVEPLPSFDGNSNPYTSSIMGRRISFAHIKQFYDLRTLGHSPRSAAKILIDRYLRTLATRGTTPKKAEDVCNIDLLSDERYMDHFSHPALFARSGAVHLIAPAEEPEGLMNGPPNAVPAARAARSAFHDDGESSSSDESDNQAQRGNVREGRQPASRHDALDFVDLFGHVAISTQALDTAFTPHRQNGITHSPANHPDSRWKQPLPTLGSLLAKLRAVLALCPRIRVLALNGFLERAIAGSRECAALCELRHLSLGPPPPYWSSALNLEQKTLNSLHSLHVSGCMLFRSEAMAIGGFTPALKNLREIDWTLWLEHAVEHPIDVVQALSLMLGSEPSNSQRRVQRRKPLRKVRATLSRQDVTFWNNNASQELRQDPRLNIRHCSSSESDVNLIAVRRWWEKKAGLV